jgi:hypothetical protein
MKHENHTSNIWKLSFYLVGYVTPPFQEYQLVNARRKIIPVYCETCMKHGDDTGQYMTLVYF